MKTTAKKKHKNKEKHKKNKTTYFSCTVFTSSALDISSVFLVLMLMSSALLQKTAQDK